MGKTAEQILQAVEQRCCGYEQMESNRARDSFQILEQLLNSISFQRKLAREYDNRKNGRHVFSDYPDWAYSIAHKLYDPDREFGRNGKVGLAGLCKEMLQEFGQDDRYYTTTIAQEKDIPFLAQVAEDLLAK